MYHGATPCQCRLKENFFFRFFWWIIFPQALKIALGSFRIFQKICGDIRKWRCTTGVNYTGGIFCRRYQWYQRCSLSCEYLRKFSKKFEMAPNGILRGLGKLIHEKYLKSKISSRCPFNPPVGDLDLASVHYGGQRDGPWKFTYFSCRDDFAFKNVFLHSSFKLHVCCHHLDTLPPLSWDRILNERMELRRHLFRRKGRFSAFILSIKIRLLVLEACKLYRSPFYDILSIAVQWPTYSQKIRTETVCIIALWNFLWYRHVQSCLFGRRIKVGYNNVLREHGWRILINCQILLGIRQNIAVHVHVKVRDNIA